MGRLSWQLSGKVQCNYFGGKRVRVRRCVDRSRNQSYVAGSQGMQAASGNWKRQGLDSFLEPPFFSLFKKYLCIWLHWVLVAACGIFSFSMRTLSCIMWDLVPWTETEHGPPAMGAWRLSHWTTRRVPRVLTFKVRLLVYTTPEAPVKDLQSSVEVFELWQRTVCNNCHWLHTYSVPGPRLSTGD